MLETQVNDAIKNAMLTKNTETLNALRLIKSMFMNLNTSGKTITENDRLKALQTMVKQRNDSAAIYKENNRMELYDKEIFEIKIIEGFLPAKMSDEDIEKEIKEIMMEMGIKELTQKEMGKVIGATNKKLVGKADGKIISEMVKKLCICV